MKRMGSKITGARNVDEYLAAVPKDARATLERVRQTIQSIVPDADEVISYQMPTFKHKGRMLISFAAFSEHCSLFPGAAPIAAHQKELKAYPTSKGTIRFPIGKPLPATLVRKLIKARIKEIEARQKK